MSLISFLFHVPHYPKPLSSSPFLHPFLLSSFSSSLIPPLPEYRKIMHNTSALNHMPIIFPLSTTRDPVHHSPGWVQEKRSCQAHNRQWRQERHPHRTGGRAGPPQHLPQWGEAAAECRVRSFTQGKIMENIVKCYHSEDQRCLL